MRFRLLRCLGVHLNNITASIFTTIQKVITFSLSVSLTHTHTGTGFQDWAQSVRDAPAAVKYEMDPIFRFFPKEKGVSEKKRP